MESEDNQSWLLKIFGNPTIFRVLLKYISWEGMKNFRLVCSSLNTEIVTSKRFSNNGIFVISRSEYRYQPNCFICKCESVAQMTNFHILETSDFFWKQIKFDLRKDDGAKATESKSIQNYAAEHAEYLCFLDCIEDHEEFDVLNVPLLKNWLTETPDSEQYLKMKELELPFLIMNSCDISKFPFVTEKITKLRTTYNRRCPNVNSAIVTSNLNVIADKMHYLTDVGIHNFLVSILKPEERQAITRILEVNKKQLSSLSIDERILAAFMAEKKKCIFPSLRNLKILSESFAGSCASEFMHRHPNLENLTCSMREIPEQLIWSLKSINQYLRNLCLKIEALSEEVDFSFLKGMENLEVLTIIVSKEREVPQNIWKLPNSLKTLYIQGMSVEPFRIHEILTHSSPATQQFQNIIELSLLDCGALLNDQDLQAISSRMTNLTKLEFSHCPDITDFGITGIAANGENSNIAINNLKGLRTLTMASCKTLTNGIIPALVFNELERLNLGRNKSVKINESVLKVLLPQNPQLRQLYFTKGSFFTPFVNLKDVVRRLTQGRCALFLYSASYDHSWRRVAHSWYDWESQSESEKWRYECDHRILGLYYTDSDEDSADSDGGLSENSCDLNLNSDSDH